MPTARSRFLDLPEVKGDVPGHLAQTKEARAALLGARGGRAAARPGPGRAGLGPAGRDQPRPPSRDGARRALGALDPNGGRARPSTSCGVQRAASFPSFSALQGSAEHPPQPSTHASTELRRTACAWDPAGGAEDVFKERRSLSQGLPQQEAGYQAILHRMALIVDDLSREDDEVAADSARSQSPQELQEDRGEGLRRKKALQEAQRRSRACLKSASELDKMERAMEKGKQSTEASAAAMEKYLAQSKRAWKEKEERDKLDAVVPPKVDQGVQASEDSEKTEGPLADRLRRRKHVWDLKAKQAEPARHAVEFRHHYENLVRELCASSVVRVKLSAPSEAGIPGSGPAPGKLCVPESEGLTFQDGVGSASETVTLEGPLHRVNLALSRGELDGQVLRVHIAVLGATATTGTHVGPGKTAAWQRWLEAPRYGRLRDANARHALVSRIEYHLCRAPELTQVPAAFAQFLTLWSRREYVDPRRLRMYDQYKELAAAMSCLVDYRDELREAFLVYATRDLRALPERLRVGALGFEKACKDAAIARDMRIGGTRVPKLQEVDVKLAFLEALHVVDHRHDADLPELDYTTENVQTAMSFFEKEDLSLTLFEWSCVWLHLAVRWAARAGHGFFAPARSLRALLVQVLPKLRISWALSATQCLDVPEIRTQVEARRPQLERLYSSLFAHHEIDLEGFVVFLRKIGLCDVGHLRSTCMETELIVELFYACLLRDVDTFDTFPEVMQEKATLHCRDFPDLVALVGLLPLLETENTKALAVQLDQFFSNVVFTDVSVVYDGRGAGRKKKRGKSSKRTDSGPEDDPMEHAGDQEDHRGTELAEAWILKLQDFDPTRCVALRKGRFAFLR